MKGWPAATPTGMTAWSCCPCGLFTFTVSPGRLPAGAHACTEVTGITDAMPMPAAPGTPPGAAVDHAGRRDAQRAVDVRAPLGSADLRPAANE